MKELEMEKQIDISKKSVGELKAMAFEFREQIDKLSNNLNVLRLEIYNREQETEQAVNKVLKK